MARGRREPPRRESKTFSPEDATRAKERLLTRIRELKALDPNQPDFVERAKIAVDNSTATVRDVFGETSDESHSFVSVLYNEDGEVTAAGFLDPHYDRHYAERVEFARWQGRVTRLAPRLENLLSIVDEKTIGDSRASREAPAPSQPTSRRVFVVHGHDGEVREAVARTLERLDLQPIILHEQPDKGRTIIEKLEAHKEEAGYAVVLMTPDDVGGPKGTAPDAHRARARQNVLVELGLFLGTLGRSRVTVLYHPDVEMPSDYAGVLYKKWDGAEGAWRFQLAGEIHAAGIPVDLNRLMR